MRIKDVMKDKGLMAKDVAEIMGVTQPTVCRMVNGNITVDTLHRIANALDVPAAELLERPKQGLMYCPHCGEKIKFFKG